MARFTCVTDIEASTETVFDLSLSIDVHVASMAESGERAVAGRTTGTIGLGETVTWVARHLCVRWRMTSRIAELERPAGFVDEQVRGPFARFRHEHSFTETPNGHTLMVDRIDFAAPLGPLGRLAERLRLAEYVHGLIEERNRYIKDAAEHPSIGNAPLAP